ncbi:hypothetical protein AB1L88_22390 [Tautonia sp. JC769]|uniref:hypothetical protein n=1 Tax=Tautonia sp. JC769 TaxID=3232135 RepID=UPI0034582B1D
MRSGLRRIGGIAAAAALLVGSGCGGGRPSVDTSTAEGTVSGTVMLRGKPAAGHTIAFDPSNVERKFEPARSAVIGEDGSYTVTTLVGVNQVTFSGPLIDQDPELQYAATSIDVARGENTLDVELPMPGGSGGP